MKAKEIVKRARKLYGAPDRTVRTKTKKNTVRIRGKARVKAFKKVRMAQTLGRNPRKAWLVRAGMLNVPEGTVFVR